MVERNSHCSFCGNAFAPGQPWPRVCANCKNISYHNPVPVAVTLVPVDDGLLVVRRGAGNEAGVGLLGLPGGYIDYDDANWQAAAAREVWEETGLRIDPAEVHEVRVFSGGRGTVLIFCLAKPRATADLPPFKANSEATERLVITRPEPMAFDTHSQVVREYFEGRYR